MAGINNTTGKPLDGWDHVVQSIVVIFTTAFGTRVLRRWFGSSLLAILGRNLVPSTVVQFFAAIIGALEVVELHTGLPREPRFKIISIVPDGSPEELRLGKLKLTITGIYMPRGHLGDFTPAGVRSFTITRDEGGSFQAT